MKLTKNFRTDLDTLQFQLSFFIPKIMAQARYRSSGVLIMVKASGGGEYWGEYGECGDIRRPPFLLLAFNVI